MSRRAEQHRVEMAQYRQIKAYYASIRRPVLERATFFIALLASIAVSFRRLGIVFVDYQHESQWLTLAFWISVILFAVFDLLFAKTPHPVPIAFGSFNPGRIYEKFAMQERMWQLLLVLMLPVTARLIATLHFWNAVR